MKRILFLLLLISLIPSLCFADAVGFKVSDGDVTIGAGGTTSIETISPDTTFMLAFANLSTACKILITKESPEGRISASRCDLAMGINGNNEGAIWFKHTGDATPDGWKKIVADHVGRMHLHDNAVALDINTADSPHFIFGLFSSHTANGFTFSLGDNGTTDAFSDYGGTVPGAVLIQSAHTLTGSQPITIDGTTNYNGAFEATVVDGGSFYIIDTFVADDAAGNWARGDCMITDTGSGDDYSTRMNGFGFKVSGGGTNHRFEFELYHYVLGSDPVPIESAEDKKAFNGIGVGNADDFSGGGSILLADADQICIAILADGHTNNFTSEHIIIEVKN